MYRNYCNNDNNYYRNKITLGIFFVKLLRVQKEYSNRNIEWYWSDIFYNNIQPVQETLGVEGYRVRGSDYADI